MSLEVFMGSSLAYSSPHFNLLLKHSFTYSLCQVGGRFKGGSFQHRKRSVPG